MKNIYDIEFVEGFILMCDDGWQQGWHERNGGNLSYRLSDNDVNEIKEFLNDNGKWHSIGANVPDLANEYFMVTGSGKFFRNVIIDPENNVCIIKINETGDKYKIVWGLKNGGRPTSELPSHLMNHQVKKSCTNGEHRVIYHCHTTNVIALTFVLPLDEKVFTRELWEMATECPVVFPDGVGVVDWMVPGGEKIAIETSKLMEKYDVAIWAHHGIFCSGPNFDITFGLAHTVEKSAEILVKVLSITPNKLQTITPDNFRDLAKDFKVTLPEKFLYEK
ncbi:rhamnulose-1-phosphate aldolase [Eubacterium sp.]